jgi:hypothetical protein
MKAFAVESLGFSVRKIADFSRGIDPVVDVSTFFLYPKNPNLTDEVRKIPVVSLSPRGPVEIPVRRIEESGGRMTVSGIRHSVSTLQDSILSGNHTKKEWREFKEYLRSEDKRMDNMKRRTDEWLSNAMMELFAMADKETVSRVVAEFNRIDSNG